MKNTSKLAPNFTLNKLLIGNEEAIPPTFAVHNLVMLAQRLQVIHDLYGGIYVQSGFCTPEHNKALGRDEKSLHLTGMAAEITIATMSPRELQKVLENWSGGMGCYEKYTYLDISSVKARW